MSEIIKQTQTIVVDKIQVLSINLQAFPPENQAIIINYAEGYDDADGKFIPVGGQKQKAAVGADLLAIMQKYPTLYGDLKTISYEISEK